MNTKIVLIALIIISTTFSSCKKENNSPTNSNNNQTSNPTTNDSLKFIAEIGSAGTALNQFNFNAAGSDMEWGMTNDDSYVYIADRGNHCIKKVDLTSNSIVGWYGYNNGKWGYYTTSSTPDKKFTPVRLMFKNNFIYAIANRGYNQTSNRNESRVFKINSSNGDLVDTNSVIPVYSFYSCCIDNNENIFICNDDSIKKYNNGFLNGFGGFGSSDGKLDNSGYIVQIQMIGDTLVVVDAGNDRFQLFDNKSSFISKIKVPLGKNYTYFVADNNKYYLSNGDFQEYDSKGNKLKSRKVSANGFYAGQGQFVIVKNKVIYQDAYKHRLLVFQK